MHIFGDRFSTLEGFFDEVERVLIPGAKWGKNLDAFNDILRGGFGTPEGGFDLHWENSGLSRERLGYAETIRQLESILSQCHSTARAKVSKELDDASRGIGPTVFDWLVEIMRVHGPAGREAEDGVVLVLK